MSVFLLSLFSVLIACLAWRKTDWAVCLLILLWPSYAIRFKLLGLLPFNFLSLAVSIVFFTWLIKIVLVGGFWKKKYSGKLERPFALGASLLLLASFISIFVGGYTDSAMGLWKAYFFEPLLFFILVLANFRRREDLSKIVYTLAVLSFAVSVLAFYQKVTGQFIPNKTWADLSDRRVTSFFSYPNAVGLLLGPLVMIFWGFWQANFSKKIFSRQSLFFLVIIFSSLLSIYFAKSEGAVIGLAVAMFFYALLANWKWRGLAITAASLVAVSIFFWAPAHRYADKVWNFKDKSLIIRKMQWQETIEMLSDNGRWATGAGLAKYQTAITPYHQDGFYFNKDNDPDFKRKLLVYNKKYKQEHWQPVEIYLYPHNIVLNFWSELGLLGLLIFILLYGEFFYRALIVWKRDRRENLMKSYFVLGLAAAMLVSLVHGLVDVPYFKNDLALLFWLLLSMVAVLYRDYCESSWRYFWNKIKNYVISGGAKIYRTVRSLL